MTIKRTHTCFVRRLQKKIEDEGKLEKMRNFLNYPILLRKLRFNNTQDRD